VVKPLGDRVIVKRIEGEEVLASGIVLPHGEDRANSHEGMVLAVGPGEWEDGSLIPVDVEVGDRIIYSSRIDAREIDGEQVDIVQAGSIVAKR
jgi:chaperonin GroES